MVKDSYRSFLTAFTFFCVAAIYVVFRGKSYLYDGILYAAVSAREHPDYFQNLFHPNHFIFNLLGFVCNEVIKFLHLPIENSYHSLQVMNSFFGVGGVILFYVWLRRSLQSYFLAICGAVFLAFSSMYWWHSIEGQVYIVNAFFLIIVGIAAQQYAQRRDWISLVFFAVAASLSVLAHQSNILIVVASLSLIYDWKKLLVYAGILFLLIVVPYGAVIFLVFHCPNFSSAFEWLLGVGKTYGAGTYMSPYWSFSPENLLITVQTLFKVFWFDDGAARFFQGAVIIFLSIIIFRYNDWKKEKSFLVFSWTLITLYLLFFSFWNVGNRNYLLAVGIFFLFYLLRSLSSFAARKKSYALITKIFLSIVLVVTFVYNGKALWPRTRIENNAEYLRAEALAKVVTPADVLIIAGVAGYQTGKVYLPYFYNIPCLALDVLFIRKGKTAGLRFLKQMVQEDSGPHETVYVLDEVFTVEEARSLMEQYWDIKEKDLQSIFGSVQKKKITVFTRKQEPVILYKIVKGGT